jgi:hypothetical protein
MIVRPRRATWHINHERGIAAEAILPLPQTLEGGDHVFNRCDQFDLVGGERKGASKRGFCHRVRMERAEAGGCSATRMMAGHQSCRATPSPTWCSRSVPGPTLSMQILERPCRSRPAWRCSALACSGLALSVAARPDRHLFEWVWRRPGASRGKEGGTFPGAALSGSERACCTDRTLGASKPRGNVVT